MHSVQQIQGNTNRAILFLDCEVMRSSFAITPADLFVTWKIPECQINAMQSR